MITSLGPLVEGVVTTAPRSERSVQPIELADRIRDLVDSPILVAEDVELALDMARAEAGPEGAVLVAGSLYLVGEARQLLV
jgi:dihydrofolate synthase/folylpolyglutamate synthase